MPHQRYRKAISGLYPGYTKSYRSKRWDSHSIVRKVLFYTLLPLLVVGFSGCSRQSSKWANVTYHNTTCHYNTWWNGNESLKAGKKKLHEAATDDYTMLLPVEQLGTSAQARSINPEMDRAVEKGIKGIKQHSIFINGEEHVPYVKECYLMTAYATFYKQDYVATQNTCQILLGQFAGTRAADEAGVLLARCYVREKRYAEAEVTLDQLVIRLENKQFSSKQKDKLYLAMVEATVPQKKYKKAVEYIHLGIKSTNSRQVKARLTYLLAQIYQELDRRPVAAKYYRQVLKYSPEYVMEFNARLGEASCAEIGHTDVARIERQLDAMLRDRKNREYRDQIYYAKGMMYLGVKDAQRGCDNLRLSVAYAVNNRAQRAKSALKLGEVLYDVYEDYDQAQRYYDTVMQSITADYPNYNSIKRRADILTDLTSYTRTYARADSLLAVAAMPEAERMKLIQDKIDSLKAREQREREAELLRQMSADAQAQENTLKGDWYFYNSNTVQKGKEAFQKTWGTRVLEDNWFISNKPDFSQLTPYDDLGPADLVASGAEANADEQNGNVAKVDPSNPNDPHNVAYYLRDLPTTQAQRDSLDTLIANNLLNAAYLYYDGVHNIPKALECYHRLATDYTGYAESVQTFYMLYRIYDRQGNTPQANYYRDMVLMGFPDSDFANLIRDNEYYKELLRREHVVEELYAEQYEDFEMRRYASVISIANQAEQLYAGHSMLPKFRYLKSLALNATGHRNEAIEELGHVIASLNRSDSLYQPAQKQLEFMQVDSTLREEMHERREAPRRERMERLAERMEQDGIAEQQGNELPPEAQVFRYRENQQYYVIVLIDDRRVRATELQYKLTDFNTQYYSNASLRVNAMLFNDTTQMLTVHRFANAAEAMNYYNHLYQEESPLRALDESTYRCFAISTQNYATFYTRKNPDAYELYFRRYHLENQ